MQIAKDDGTFLVIVLYQNDCDIKDNIGQTFAFDKLMTGISKAYSKISNSDDYLKLKLSINH